MSRTALALLALVVLVAPALPAAAEVYLNGVDITGVRDQTFEKATVRIDAQGNVHIEAPGYAVAREGPPQTPADARPRSRYYLVTTGEAAAETQYAVDVFVNGRWAARIRAGEAPPATEITDALTRGRNRVLLVARKDLSEGRRSRSPGKWMRIRLGEGAESDSRVLIERTFGELTVDASQTGDVSKELELDVP